MYFVVEHIDQLDQMSPSDSCFIQVISHNDLYHPKLTNLSLIYYNDFDKGYIFVINHCEGLSLETKSINKFISNHKKVYLLDKKYHSYFIDVENCIDLQFISMNRNGKFQEFDCNTLLHRDFYQKHPEDPELNKIVPISKHYEKCECLFGKIQDLVDLETDIKMEERLVRTYGEIEKCGIKIDQNLFDKFYKIPNKQYSIKDSIVYSLYNLYNITGRPTNSFNGVNFLAIPKDDDFRKCFLPKNDILVEFDFDAYHLRLIANLIGFDCPKESMHILLGREYFQTQELTDQEYKKSKEITFKQLYGGIEDQYKNIEFFSSLNNYIEKEWKKYNKFGATVLATGRTINKREGLNKLRLFNYIVQNLETKENIDKIEQILDYLKDKKSQLILITYDSFLFDYSLEDGKKTLTEIKNILQTNNMIVKHKYGKDYSFE